MANFSAQAFPVAATITITKVIKTTAKSMQLYHLKYSDIYNNACHGAARLLPLLGGLAYRTNKNKWVMARKLEIYIKQS